MGTIQQVRAQSGPLVLREGVTGEGVQRTLEFGPGTRIVQLGRDRARRITAQVVTQVELRPGDDVVIQAARQGNRTLAMEIRVAPRGGPGE